MKWCCQRQRKHLKEGRTVIKAFEGSITRPRKKLPLASTPPGKIEPNKMGLDKTCCTRSWIQADVYVDKHEPFAHSCPQNSFIGGKPPRNRTSAHSNELYQQQNSKSLKLQNNKKNEKLIFLKRITLKQKHEKKTNVIEKKMRFKQEKGWF